MPSITREEVAHLAKLSRLELSDAELDHFAGQLDAIVGAVARVGELPTGDVPPTSHAQPLTNVFRADVVRPAGTPILNRDEVLAQAPAAEDHRFRVPRILGED
ncbi:MAG: Asp-tRNA(Asn)/Glu-tRNA(Gln) amidotransferase subunit GatC [Actinocrinis sp.]